MTSSSPRPGDRVRVTYTVDGVMGDDGSVRCDGGAGLMRLSDEHVSVEVLAPAERWKAGGVYVDANNPHDGRAWAYCPRNCGSDWVQLHSYGDRTDREHVPAKLTLLVRAGRPVLPEPSDEDLRAVVRDLVSRTGIRSFPEHLLPELVRVLDERRRVIRP